MIVDRYFTNFWHLCFFFLIDCTILLPLIAINCTLSGMLTSPRELKWFYCLQSYSSQYPEQPERVKRNWTYLAATFGASFQVLQIKFLDFYQGSFKWERDPYWLQKFLAATFKQYVWDVNFIYMSLINASRNTESSVSKKFVIFNLRESSWFYSCVVWRWLSWQ